ncbi:MAG: hypothetical protein AAF479_05245, partial [Pseudomonadota bacterium]
MYPLKAALWALTFTLCFATVPFSVQADQSGGATEQELGTVTKLPIPRYVSLRSSKINVRRGPGLDYR